MFKQLFIGLLLLPIVAFGDTFVLGKDYEIIKGNTNSNSDKPITVTEFFSYGCPWCYQIEQPLNQWLIHHNSRVSFTRVPVIFNSDWSYYAKAYYTASLLKIDRVLNPLLFKAVQIDKLVLNSNQAMIDFFIKNGANKDVVDSAFTHSTTIDMKIGDSNRTMALFHISAVPAFVIDNRYKTDLQMAESPERLFKILDYLIEQTTHKNNT